LKTEGFADVELLDCTIRDGGYINNWDFEDRVVREVYRACSKAGTHFVELGYWGEGNKTANASGPWRQLTTKKLLDITRNISGSPIAIMVDYSHSQGLVFPDAQESPFRLIRIAAHKASIFDAHNYASKLKQKGYLVALNIMGYPTYSKTERLELTQALKDTELDYLYMADSYGSMFPGQLKELLEPLLEIEQTKVGFHPHNNLQMAFANTIEAINCGVSIVDGTIYGMGRAAGNLPTEIILSFLERYQPDRFNSIPVLNVVDRFFVSLAQTHRWGYQLPYMLSGMYECHPNYPKKLVDQREYSVEDIWFVLKELMTKKPSGYEPDLLDEIIESGIHTTRKTKVRNVTTSPEVKSKTENTFVPYADRHVGRDFLVLANGPSLQTHQKSIQQFIDERSPIILGANNLKGAFVPHYHAFANERRFLDYIDTVNPDSQLLLSEHISPEVVAEYTDRQYEKLRYLDSTIHPFDIQNSVITTSCRTVSVLLVGVAIVMGARHIYCAGLDGYSNIEPDNVHFYKENYQNNDEEILMDLHQWCQHFLEQIDHYLVSRNRDSIHILTPTTYKSFHTGIENYLTRAG